MDSGQRRRLRTGTDNLSVIRCSSVRGRMQDVVVVEGRDGGKKGDTDDANGRARWHIA